MELKLLALIPAVLFLVGYVAACIGDRRRLRAAREQGLSRPAWRMPSPFRPLRRFKATMRAIQWGEFVNSREGTSRIDENGEVVWKEPDLVTFRDFANFIRLWPNPGFQLTRKRHVYHWCRNPKCPIPRKRVR